MASATEAELGALFLNCQEAVPIRIKLEEMGHPQPPTPVQVDNSTALVIATGTIKQPHVHHFGLALLDCSGCYSQCS